MDGWEEAGGEHPWRCFDGLGWWTREKIHPHKCAGEGGGGKLAVDGYLNILLGGGGGLFLIITRKLER